MHLLYIITITVISYTPSRIEQSWVWSMPAQYQVTLPTINDDYSEKYWKLLDSHSFLAFKTDPPGLKTGISHCQFSCYYSGRCLAVSGLISKFDILYCLFYTNIDTWWWAHSNNIEKYWKTMQGDLMICDSSQHRYHGEPHQQ